ncbi:MAG: RloB family protein [Prevotella sp.]|nr:RloB family protein [Prevotella sp.]
MVPNKGMGNNVCAMIGDGETEQWYFQSMRNANATSWIIKFLKSTSKKPKEAFKYIQEEALKGYDKVYWMIDLDVIIKNQRNRKPGEDYYQEINEVFQACQQTLKQSKGKIIFLVNNPCFEYWFLLHIKETQKYYQTFEDLLPELHKDKECLSKYCKSKNYFLRGEGLYAKLQKRVDDAIDRARKISRFKCEDFEHAYAETYIAVEELKK